MRIAVLTTLVSLVAVSCISPVLVAQPDPAPGPATPIYAAGAVAAPIEETDAADFYQPLLPYGQWNWLPPYGWVWRPGGLPIGWRPYWDGYWTLSDDGWFWVSDWPWAWACFHYGRWHLDPTFGWVWCPGTVWAPSWVVWRVGGGCIGWAALPPECIWREGFGLDFGGVDFDLLIRPFDYCFVEERDFCDRDLRHRIFLSARNVTLFRETKRDLDYAVSKGRVVNRFHGEERLEKAIGHAIPRLHLAEATNPSHAHMGSPGAGQILVYKPTIHEHKGLGGPAAVIQTGPEWQKRHKAENRALEDYYSTQQKLLEEHHKNLLEHPPTGFSPELLKQQQDAERRALEEQGKHERLQLERRHKFEEKTYTPPPPLPPSPPSPPPPPPTERHGEGHPGKDRR